MQISEVVSLFDMSMSTSALDGCMLFAKKHAIQAPHHLFLILHTQQMDRQLQSSQEAISQRSI